MIKENFIRLFEDAFRKYWDMPAYSNYGENITLTYADVANRMAKMHILFEQCNIHPNDKIALIGRNNANWAITYLATVTYGAIIVPILQDFNPNDVHHITNHSESKLLFTSDNVWENLEEEKLTTVQAVFSLTDFNCITVIDRKTQNEQDDTDFIIERNQVKPDVVNTLFRSKFPHGFHKDHVRFVDKSNLELVSINYTSGTTGFSKGVMTSGNALAGNITFAIGTGIIEEGYKIISFLPLAHAYGCAFDFLTATCRGCHVYFIGKIPSPKILLTAFAEIKPNVIFLVPLIIEKIYKKQIQPLIAKPTIRWVLRLPFLDQTILVTIRKKLIHAFGGEFAQLVCGGAPMNAEVEEFLQKIKFPFTVGYGMTECAPLISFTPSDRFVPKSAGEIIPQMEVKVVEADPNTGIGELCVRGENLMLGYYKNQEATDSIIDDDGWLHTGDLGMVDEQGNIFIKGRSKTMLLGPSGQNIYPEEIEAKLNNMPFVMESLVVENNGRLQALVYPDYEAVDLEKLDQKQLEKVMEENRIALNNIVASYESVAKIHLYPNEFEKTPKKSIKRYLYATAFSDKQSADNQDVV
ncbi:MAG: AMP-binding protein [Paludibacter sp.]|nr:AMP-binding protein [Paludibacter sp.]MDD4198989.1 AMP-binding protein [Paludibacter sp.]MDD4426821.1 AMP-binding protein [Paludibacter sp.]